MNHHLDKLKFSGEATALINVWRALPLRDGAVCPRKTDFNPMQMRRFLRSVFLYERCAKGNVNARVMGTKIDQLMGRYFTGKNILKLVPPEHIRALSVYYENLHQHKCAGTMERPIHSADGGSYMIKTLQLPLLDEKGEASFFIGVAVPGSLPKHFTDYRSASVRASRSLDINYINIGAGMPEHMETTLARGVG